MNALFGPSTSDIYDLYDKRRRDQEAMSLLPGDAEGFHPLLPQMTAQSQGLSPEQYASATQGNGVGVFGKLLGGLGLDAEGHRASQPWGNALMQTAGTLVDPVGTAGHFVGGVDQSFQDLDRLLQHPSHDPEWGREIARPAFDITSTVAMGGGAVPKQAGTAGTFGGRLAKTADHAQLARAEEMAGRGVPREQIWNDTGWFKGVDGKWRFEIDDSGVRRAQKEGALRDVLPHPDLYAAYPPLGDVPVSTVSSFGEYTAAYHPSANGGNGAISYAPFRSWVNGGAPSVLLHEGQHGVQLAEGFAQGGNGLSTLGLDRETSRKIYADALRKASSGREYPTIAEREAAAEAAAMEAYKRQAGEVEARTVQKRMDMTPKQRAARPPWLDYDVPEAQQIVRFGNGPNALFSNSKEASAPGIMAGAGREAPRVELHGRKLHSGKIVGDDVTPEAQALWRKRSPGEFFSNKSELPGIVAYHGSPHDFDRFDFSKIGTGEGAQAYGHGGYFADNEAVASSYKGVGPRQAWSSLDPPTTPGHMYQVRINADPAHFLDLDKSLSQQSDVVTKKARSKRARLAYVGAMT